MYLLVEHILDFSEFLGVLQPLFPAVFLGQIVLMAHDLSPLVFRDVGGQVLDLLLAYMELEGALLTLDYLPRSASVVETS